MTTEATRQRRYARTRASLDAAFTYDMGLLRLATPFRLAFAIVFFLVIGQLTGHLALAVSASLGAFMCGFSDQSDAYPLRFRLMGVTAVAVTAAAFVGGQLSDYEIAIILMSALVAAVCGFTYAFGIEAGLVGVLALVTYTVFAGSPVGEGVAIQQAIAVLVGALLQLSLAVVGWPLRRCGGARGQLADVWRTTAVALHGAPSEMFSAVLPIRLIHAANELDASSVEGETHKWLTGILADVDAIRIPLGGLSVRLEEKARHATPEEVAALGEFRLAVARFCRQVARTLVFSFRRRGLEPALAEVKRSGAHARKFAPEQVDRVINALTRTSQALNDVWPIGPRGKTRLRPAQVKMPTWSELGALLANATDARRHAIRLAGATSLAWVVGDLALANHKYWVPLTVAWVARPGFGVTLGRVVARTGGTLVGLGLVSIFVLTVEPGIWTVIGVCAVAGYILYVAFPVNYALAVVFITILIVSLIELAGSTFQSAIGQRAIGTVLGALITLVMAYVGPSKVAPSLAQRLVDVTTGARAVSAAQLVDGEIDVVTMSQMISARTKLSEAIDASKFEPTPAGLKPDDAKAILDAVLAAVFEVASVSAGTRKAFGDEIDADGLDSDWLALREALGGKRAGVQVDVTAELDPARAAVQRAIVIANSVG